jgi:pilus assembly protein Flp/PilA
MEEVAMRRRLDGQAMVEYALILVLIAVVVIGVLLIMGGQVKAIFSHVSDALAGR